MHISNIILVPYIIDILNISEYCRNRMFLENLFYSFNKYHYIYIRIFALLLIHLPVLSKTSLFGTNNNTFVSTNIIRYRHRRIFFPFTYLSTGTFNE